MDANYLPTNSILIQGITMTDLERIIAQQIKKGLAVLLPHSSNSESTSSANGLFKRKETAVKLGISLVTLSAWTKAGLINSRRIGGRVYYTEKDINEALKNNSK